MSISRENEFGDKPRKGTFGTEYFFGQLKPPESDIITVYHYIQYQKKLMTKT